MYINFFLFTFGDIIAHSHKFRLFNIQAASNGLLCVVNGDQLHINDIITMPPVSFHIAHTTPSYATRNSNSLNFRATANFSNPSKENPIKLVWTIFSHFHTELNGSPWSCGMDFL